MEDKKTDSQQSNVKTKNEKIAVLKQAAQDRLKVIKIMSIPLISIFAIQLAAGVILSQVKNKENPENPTFDANKEAELSIRNSESLTPDSLTDYKNNPEVTKLIFSKKTKNIKAEAFKDFKNIEEIIFREGCQLDSIGKDAFKGMTNLKKITFEDPKAITVFDLREYTKFESVQYGKDIDPSAKIETKDQYLARWNKEVLSANDLKDVKTISYNAFSFNTNLKEVDLKSSKVSSIGQDAFQGTTLETIKFSNYFKEITNDSFKGMNTLKNVELGLNTTIIGNGAFEDTTSLEHIDLSNTQLSKVGNNAFKNSGIKNFIAPDTLKEIGDNAFNGALNLENVELSTLTKLGSLAFANSQNIKKFDVHKFNKFLPSNFENLKIKHLVIGDSIKKLSKETIDGFELQKVSFKNVNELIDDLFLDNTTLQEVDFGDKMEIIGNNAFKNCHLTTLTLPSTLKRIGKAAFENVKLENIDLPASLNFVGVSAFNNCGLKNVNFDLAKNADLHAYSFANNDFTELRLTSILDLDKKLDINTFKGCSKIKKILLSDETVLPQYFYKEYVADSRITLEEIFIPKSLVEKSYDENNLSKWFLEFANLVFTVTQDFYSGEKFTFINNENSHDIYKNLRTITYGKGCHHVTNIFDRLYLENINVKDEENINFKFVANNFFLNNINVNLNGIKKFVINPYLGYNSNSPSTFVNIYKINNINIGENLSAFSKSYDPITEALLPLSKSINQNKLIIPGFAKTINYGTLNYSSSSDISDIYTIKELILEEGIKSIGNYCFNGLKSLKRIVLPNTLESIGENCFSNLPNLEEIIWPNNAKFTSIRFSFNNINTLKKLILPNGVKSIISSFQNYYSDDAYEINLPASVDDIHNSFTNLKNVSKIEINNFGKLSIDENRTVHTSGRSSFGISEDWNNVQDIFDLNGIINFTYDTVNDDFQFTNLYKYMQVLKFAKCKKIIFDIADYSIADNQEYAKRHEKLNKYIQTIINAFAYRINDVQVTDIEFRGHVKYLDINIPKQFEYDLNGSPKLYKVKCFDLTHIILPTNANLEFLSGNLFSNSNVFGSTVRLPKTTQISTSLFANNKELETIEMSHTTSFSTNKTYDKDGILNNFLFKGNTKLNKIKLYDLDNLELSLGTITIDGEEYKYILPTDEYYNKIKNNASLEWKGSYFMFTLLGLKKYDKKIILNSPNSLFFKSYSDISYAKDGYSYSQIFNSINLPNQLKQLFSDKLHINELEIKEIYKNILDFKWLFNDLSLENVILSKKMDEYICVNSYYRDEMYGNLLIKKINGKSEINLYDFLVNRTDQNGRLIKYIPDFLSRFVGKIKVSSDINDVEFASNQEICINFLFSELEVLAGVTKMPIFRFTSDFSRSPIKNVTLPENFQFTAFDYDNYFILPIKGIEKINNKSEWNYQEFLNKFTINKSLIFGFIGKVIVNSKIDIDDKLCLWSELSLENGYAINDKGSTGISARFYNLSKFNFDPTIDFKSKYLFSLSNTLDNKRYYLNNLIINGISNQNNEINLKNLTNIFGEHNVNGLVNMLFSGNIDFSNTKLVIPEGFDFSQIYIGGAKFKEIEIEGNIDLDKLPVFNSSSIYTKKLSVSNSKLVQSASNDAFWTKISERITYGQINDELTEIDLNNWKASHANYFAPLKGFNGKLVISSDFANNLWASNYFDKWKAKEVEFKEGITRIGGKPFSSETLKKIILPNSLNEIDAFKNYHIEELVFRNFNTDVINLRSWLQTFGNSKFSLGLLGSLKNKSILIPNNFVFGNDIEDAFVENIEYNNWKEIIFEEGRTKFPGQLFDKLYNKYQGKQTCTITFPKSINDFSELKNVEYDSYWINNCINFNFNDDINTNLDNYLSVKKFKKYIKYLKEKSKNIDVSLSSWSSWDIDYYTFAVNEKTLTDTKTTIKLSDNIFSDKIQKENLMKFLQAWLLNFKNFENTYSNYSYFSNFVFLAPRDKVSLKFNVNYSSELISQVISKIFVELFNNKYNWRDFEANKKISIEFENNVEYVFSVREWIESIYNTNYKYKKIDKFVSNNNIVTTDTLNINKNNIDLTKDGNFNMLYFFNGSKLFFSNSLNNVYWTYSDFPNTYDIQNFVNTSITEIEFEEGLNEYWISTLLKQALIKCSNIKKITLPASLKKINLTAVIQNIMQYGNTRTETDPININIKSFNTYCWFDSYYYIHNKLLDKLNIELNKLKIIYQDNFEFKFISNSYSGKYLKPLNFNSADIDQNHYLNNMNIMLKINLLMANYLPSLGNDSNITVNKKLIQEWHEQYSNESSFLNYIFKAKLAFSNSNETNVTINQYKITSDAWEYSYTNSIADRLVNFYFEYSGNINIDNLILEASNADLSNININSSYPKLKINKLNGFDKINYNDFIVNKWPRFLMNSFKKIIIPSNTNYEGMLNFQFEVEELEFGENVTFETNSRIHALRTKKLIIPESTLNNLFNYLKLVFDDQIAANNGSRYGIVSPILGYNNQGSQENYVGFDSINNLTEIRLSEWIEKYTENILPFLHDFTGKIIFDKKVNLSKYCINSFDNKNYLFHGAKWSEIEFEDGVENIPSQVFINLKNLRKITFPNNKINIHYLNFFSSNLNRNIEIINGESIKHNLSWLSDEWRVAYNKNGVKLFALQIDSLHTKINKLIIEEGYEKIALDDSIFACAAKDIIQDYGNVDYELTKKPLLDKFTLELPSTIDMIKSGSFDYLLKYKESAGVNQYTKAIEIKVHADDEKFAKIKKLIEDSVINKEYLKSITIIQEN